MRKVRKTEDMPPEDFVSHMNLRHAQAGELANLEHLDQDAAKSDKDRFTWEAYHKRLHDYRSYEHGH